MISSAALVLSILIAVFYVASLILDPSTTASTPRYDLIALGFLLLAISVAAGKVGW